MTKFPILYNEDEKEFKSLGEGILKDCISCKVTHVRNGQYDLELEYPPNSRLSPKLKKKKYLKVDAGKRFKKQIFRIKKVNTDINGNLKVYARHISFDLEDNFVAKVDLKGVKCLAALNALKNGAAFSMPFNFASDITHTSNFKIERVSLLNALGGTEGSIIDTYGNGANIVRDNFNISIMQNYGNDNNVLIGYGKNMTELDIVDEDNIVTGIYPFALKKTGIDSSNSTTEDLIELEEKYIFREDYKNFKSQRVVPVDFSDNDSVKDIKSLKEKASNYFKTYTDESLSVKVDYLDQTYLSKFEDADKLQTLDVYDTVIIRHLKLGINYKSQITKVVYDPLMDRYESIELGNKRTNLSSTITNTNETIKTEIHKTNNFWQQCVENATKQITGNAGGFVKMYPPDKPSEIFIMDKDDVNEAKNILRMNKQGIGFSNNGVNGPFETAWTCDGTFYANFITAGILSTVLIQNLDGSFQIDLSSNNGALFKEKGKDAIRIHNNSIDLFNWAKNGDFIGALMALTKNEADGTSNPNKPLIGLINDLDSAISIGYKNGENDYKSYAEFDKNNIMGDDIGKPFRIYEEVDFKDNNVYRMVLSSLNGKNYISVGDNKISISFEDRYYATLSSEGVTIGDDNTNLILSEGKWHVNGDIDFSNANVTGLPIISGGVGGD